MVQAIDFTLVQEGEKLCRFVWDGAAHTLRSLTGTTSVERMWHMQDIQGQILDLACKGKV